jgi:type IV pilus assembly protein PilX
MVNLKAMAINRKPAMRRDKQSGIALIVIMLILLAMTIVGVTAVSTTVLEERMASNTRQTRIGFQAAEVALRAAEDWLINNVNTAADLSQFDGTVNGLYSQRIALTAIYTTAPINWDYLIDSNWTTTNSIGVTTIPMLPANANLIPGPPRYAIEYVGRVGEPPTGPGEVDVRKYAFRIVAIGWGQETSVPRVLTSTFRMAL